MNVEFKKSKLHGNGIFAITDIQKDEIIEICPIIILNEKDTKEIDNTHLYNYYFSWKENGSAISLGFGSIYNHSYEPNAKYEKDFLNSKIIFKSIKTIKKEKKYLLIIMGIQTTKKKFGLIWTELTNLLRFATHHAALSSFQSSGHLTRDKRKIAQVAIFPNFSSATLQKKFFYP